MIGVFIIPTGIGAEIGGHAGDATPAAKLIASCCDTLIVHPNVVNASDINEMTDNMWYVEGSTIDRMLEGSIGFLEPKPNRVLVVVNKPVRNETINAVSAARATIGLDAKILELGTPLEMIGRFDDDGRAVGDVFGWEDVIRQVEDYGLNLFDALAIHTEIKVDRGVALRYYREGGVNPWGGVEAIASRLIATALNKPIAHAPIEPEGSDDKELFDVYKERVDPRIAPEALSVCYFHCVLKGLHEAPRIVDWESRIEYGFGLSAIDVDFLITPYGCVGRPHEACMQQGIEIISVKENKTCLDQVPRGVFTYASDYVEAAGMVMAKKSGVSLESVKRPLRNTVVIGA